MADDASIRALPGGANQWGQRDHNARLVLSVIQRHGEMPSAEIARRTALSAQTASVITRALEAEGLLLRGAPVRGKVGKPSIPMRLNPSGVFAYGLRIGRRSADVTLMDFTGQVRGTHAVSYPYPTPGDITRFVGKAIPELSAALTEAEAEAPHLCGLGIAAPFELWNWLDTVNAPKSEMQAWRQFDFETCFGEMTGLPVFLANDGTLACNAERIFGHGRDYTDFAYFHIGAFPGGGLVLGGSLYAGRTGNAGAFGSIPVRDAFQPGAQLLSNASIAQLERRLEAIGLSPAALRGPSPDWESFPDILEDWLDETAQNLATACVAVVAVIDVEAILIDGTFPEHIRADLTRRVSEALPRIETMGVSVPHITTGALGRKAGAMGAAFQPILATYFTGAGAASPF